MICYKTNKQQLKKKQQQTNKKQTSVRFRQEGTLLGSHYHYLFLSKRVYTAEQGVVFGVLSQTGSENFII